MSKMQTATMGKLYTRDTSNDHYLSLICNEDLTADRVVSLTINDGARALALQGNLTVESAATLNQDTTTDASPTFAGATLSGISANYVLKTGAAGVVEGEATLATSRGGLGISAAAVADGQIPIGKTSDHTFALANITAGVGVTVTNGANTITLATSGGGLTPVDATADATMTAGNMYIVNKAAGACVLTTPGTCVVGDIVKIVGYHSNSYVVTAATGDTIHYLDVDTSAGGTLTPENRYAIITLICVVANSEWVAETSHNFIIT